MKQTTELWQEMLRDCTQPALTLNPIRNVITLACALFLLSLPVIGASQPRPTANQVEGSRPELKAAEFDGPAELPRSYVKSALADTPTPGKVLMVKSSGEFERALDQAHCGDTIRLQAGATFSGVFLLPAKACDDSHWIVIRSNAADTSLPREGTRITPCYAGVPSLPGRPSFNCTALQNVMAKIEFDRRAGSGPIFLADGANHYRLIGLEITRSAGTGLVGALVQAKPLTATFHHIILDRVWIHGTTRDETMRGLLLASSTHVAVVDSFFTDFHCTAVSGACTDSQAIAGGIGDGPMDSYKITNNFLEAAAENILFGGGRATATPTDIEIRHNYLFKPLTWRPGAADFVGAEDGRPFIVKNHFELKNAKRVLFEGNVLEYDWGGFSQTGSSILLTPKNQAGKDGNLCPVCQVTDVTIRYCRVSHVGGGLQLGNGRADNGAVPLDGQRYSIHDVVFDDVDGPAYRGNGFFAILSTAPSGSVPILQHVKIDHVTAFISSALFNIGGPQSPKMADFRFTNSVVTAGNAPSAFLTTGGGPPNCSAQIRDPELMLERCFSNYVVAKNVIIGSRFGSWPHSNFLVGNASDVQFANYRGGKQGDYRLSSASRYRKSASDGKDVGADIDALESAIAGVI